MSLFELLVVLIVCILVTKPKDFPQIIKRIKEIRNFMNNIKKELIDYFKPIIESAESSIDDKKKSKELNEEIEQINFYLNKIANMGIEYQGEYSLTHIKKYYHNEVKKKIKKGKKNE